MPIVEFAASPSVPPDPHPNGRVQDSVTGSPATRSGHGPARGSSTFDPPLARSKGTCAGAGVARGKTSPVGATGGLPRALRLCLICPGGCRRPMGQESTRRIGCRPACRRTTAAAAGISLNDFPGETSVLRACRLTVPDGGNPAVLSMFLIVSSLRNQPRYPA